ncbi:MAG: PQQ-dependent sugar dehydrogenase [Sumerlaeia bacterium]
MAAALTALAILGGATRAEAVPDGFEDVAIHWFDLTFCTAMEALPTGHLVTAMRDGKIYVWDPEVERPGAASTLFAQLDTTITHEGGVIGMLVHPDFESNGWIYFTYTQTRPGDNPVHITITRLTADPQDPQSAIPDSDVEIFTLPDDPATDIHYGGGLVCGPDGMLYLGLGDDGQGLPLPQDPDSLRGKILRMNPDGSVPPGNPDFGKGPTLVYALGVRNPFRLMVDHPNGVIWFADVGNSLWEEYNLLQPAANYGWPFLEGPLSANPGVTPPPNYLEPQVALPHMAGAPGGDGVSFTDSIIYRGNQFPSVYRDMHLLGDWRFGHGYIYEIKKSAPDRITHVERWHETLGPITDLVELNGELYYSTTQFFFASGTVASAIRKISYTSNEPPQINIAPNRLSGPIPLTITFEGSVSDEAPEELSYFWDFGPAGESREALPTVTFIEPSTTFVTLEVRDRGGLTASKGWTITAEGIYDVDLQARVLDVRTGVPRPFDGFLHVREDREAAPILLDAPILDGQVHLVRDDVEVMVNRLEITIQGAGVVPYTWKLSPTDFAFTDSREVLVSPHAILGTVSDTSGAPLPAVPLVVRAHDGTGFQPIPSPRLQNPIGERHTDPFGAYHFALPDALAGQLLEFSAFPGRAIEEGQHAPWTWNLFAPRNAGMIHHQVLSRWPSKVGACDYEPSPSPSVPWSEVSTILTRNCTGCHGQRNPNAGLDLTGPFAYGELMTRWSNEAIGLRLVQPGRPAASFLSEKIACEQPQSGSVMPPTGGLIPPADQQRILDWIAAGAPSGDPTSITLTLHATSTSGPEPLISTIHAGIDGGVPPFEIVWHFADGARREDAIWMTYPFAAGPGDGTTSVTVAIIDSALPAPNRASATLVLHPTPVDPPSTGSITAAIDPAARLVVHQPARLNGSSSTSDSGTILRYLWDFGDDGSTDWIGSDPLAVITPAAAGELPVRLTVIDSGNRSDTTATLFLVESPAEPAPAFSGLTVR